MALATHVSAQEIIPADNDLHSIYCSSVLGDRITFFQASLQSAAPDASVAILDELRAEIALSQAALARINAYVLPRMTLYEPTSTLMAMARGHADMKTLLDQVRSGELANVSKELSDRVNGCNHPDWLPF